MNKRSVWAVLIGIVFSVSLVSCGGGGGGGGDGDDRAGAPPTGGGTEHGGAPSPPTNVVAIPRNGQVEISWNNVTGATSYTLYMASSSGVTRTTYLSLPDGAKHSAVPNPYTQTGLTNGKTYFFVVAAVNAEGESSESTEVSASPSMQGANWSSPHTLGEGSQPDVSGDGDGNAMAVWLDYDGLLYHIYAKRFSTTNGWGAIETVADLEINEVPAGLKVAMYGQGNAFVVWHQNGGQTFGVFAKRFLAATGWEPSVRIGFGGSSPTTSGYRGSPEIAVNTAGNAVVVWEQPGAGILDNIIASYYTPGTGWSSATTIDAGSGHAEEPVVSIDPAGNAISIWKQTNGSVFSIWASRFTAGSGWGTATLIEVGASAAFSPALAMDGSGNAFAIWLQNATLLVNRFEPGAGWKGTAVLSAGSATIPNIAMNADGKAVAVWGDGHHILASRYPSGTGWSTPAQVDIGLDSLISIPHPRVVIDSAGNAVVVWQNRTNRFTGNYSTLTGSWQTPVVLSPVSCCSVTQVLFGVSSASTGNMIAVWFQDNTRTIARHLAINTNP